MSYQTIRYFRRVDVMHTVAVPAISIPANAIRQRDNEPIQQRNDEYIEHR